MTIDFEALAAPFPADEIEWRVGNRSKAGDKATLLCYLTSRAVQSRLDEVVGPARWRDAYTPLFEGGKIIGFLCELALQVEPGVWVAKVDAADVTDVEATKGGISSALKRAAVKWGVGRYLYGVDTRYYPIVKGYGPDDAVYCPLADKTAGHILRPALPASALPKPEAKPKKSDINTPEKLVASLEPSETDKMAAQMATDRAATEPGDGFPTRTPPAGATTVEPLAVEPPKKEHHPSWTDAERRSYSGAVSKLGLNVDTVADLAEHRGHPRPRLMDAVKRAKWVGWLNGPEGRAAYAAFVVEREMPRGEVGP